MVLDAESAVDAHAPAGMPQVWKSVQGAAIPQSGRSTKASLQGCRLEA